MQEQVGSSEHKIIATFGAPNGSYDMADGSKVLQYSKSVRHIIPGITTTTPQTTYHSGTINSGYGSMGSYSGTSTAYITSQSPDLVIDENCNTSFFLNAQRVVVDFSFAGNGCLSEELDLSTAPARQANAIEACGHILPPGTVGHEFEACVKKQMGGS